jgi:hypothetical protein
LSIYREANRKARSNRAPAYFSKPYNLERVVYTRDDSDESARNQLRQSIVEAQSVLANQIRAIHDAFDEAVLSYREIDDLIPEVKGATTVHQTA